MLQPKRERPRKVGGNGPSWHGYLGAAESVELDVVRDAANEYKRGGFEYLAQRQEYLAELV